MIPKIIHYCWFGGRKKPREFENYIKSWRKIFSDYQIIEWNESNFDITAILYAQEAYNERKYAFVSDVARVYALYNYGGIYLDTDVEVLKKFDFLFKAYNLVLCNESLYGIMTGFIAAEKNNKYLKMILDDYQKRKFVLPNGKFDAKPNTQLFKEIIEENLGVSYSNNVVVKNDVVIYPSDYFSAFDGEIGKIQCTENTVSIHHFKASWQPFWKRKKDKLIYLWRRMHHASKKSQNL